MILFVLMKLWFNLIYNNSVTDKTTIDEIFGDQYQLNHVPYNIIISDYFKTNITD